jgi:hypothetical protein
MQLQVPSCSEMLSYSVEHGLVFCQQAAGWCEAYRQLQQVASGMVGGCSHHRCVFW